MPGEPMHITTKERYGTMHPSYINYHLKGEVSRFVVSYAQLVTQQYESRTVQKAPL